MELKWLGIVVQFGWELNQTEYGREVKENYQKISAVYTAGTV
jgi:hypothetical protein